MSKPTQNLKTMEGYKRPTQFTFILPTEMRDSMVSHVSINWSAWLRERISEHLNELNRKRGKRK